MDIKGNIKGIVFKICILFLSLCTFLWFSIFSYSIFYYLYIPAVAHIKPVHLQYDMSYNRGSITKFPFDNITLMETEEYEFLRGGQGYAIEIILEMPESERNLNQGMFMIKLDMLDYNGNVVKSSNRPAMLRYRSYLFKMAYTLFFMPGLLAGSFEEKQSLMVPLFEKYVEDSQSPVHFAYIEIQAQAAEIYSSTLRIHAQFTGLRYLMYYWPVLSAIVGIGCNFLFLVVTIVLIWLRETMKAENDQQQSLLQSENTRRELRKQLKKRHQKSTGFIRDRTQEKKSDMPSRPKREKIEIENLTAIRALHDKKQNDESVIENEEIDEIEEYFDAEHFNPSTSQKCIENADIH